MEHGPFIDDLAIKRLIFHSYVSLPCKNCDFPQLWDSLPEGISWIWTYQQHAIFIELDNGTIETGNPGQFEP